MNEAEIIDQEAEVSDEIIKEVIPEVDVDGNPVIEDEVELDDEGNPVVVETPAFLSESEDTEEPESIPKGSFLYEKRKLKGKLSEKQKENEELIARLNKLESSIKPADSTPLEIPLEGDFDTDEEYRSARRTYEQKFRNDVVKSATQTNTQQTQQEKMQRDRDTGLAEHYERVGTMLVKHKIKQEVYDKAEDTLREAILDIRPNDGEDVFNYLTSNMGEGSEIVITNLGINKVNRKKLTDLIEENPAGHKAFRFLGKLENELNGIKTKTSQARTPAKTVKSDTKVSTQGAVAAKKKFDNAKTDQEAYDIRKAYRKSGGDVSEWS